ncbi:MAG: hypothetical protein M3438_11275 [Pseudomonadota bacterium]|uniref:hypothetical protein n=1 Tax=Sphingomonas sp. TaxID=28214 RepID=UPI00185B6B4C|nr:hypothetical protein [Sphingomonas sp.]MBA3511613.1 hypothetical protein [Sphingomonas sp.]MDQ3479714.1 hypothetical protein [Pseudomonadota bacterium]
MNTFEYITVLVSIVIGLAIADMVTSLHRLLRARKDVQWDWVSLAAALLILAELFNLWWKWHGFTGNTLGQVVPYFGVLILLFLTACATLPDAIPADGIDLGRYFDDTRPYFWSTYSAYVASWITLRLVDDFSSGATAADALALRWFDLLNIPIFIALIFVRLRWVSGVVIVATLLWLMKDWWFMRLAGEATRT